MPDAFENVDLLISQGRRAVALTPSGSTIEVPKALWLANAGDITGIPAGGSSSVTFKNAPIGVFDAVRFKVVSAAPVDTIAIY